MFNMFNSKKDLCWSLKKKISHLFPFISHSMHNSQLTQPEAEAYCSNNCNVTLYNFENDPVDKFVTISVCYRTAGI